MTAIPRIGIDAMGGDFGPSAVADGTALALREAPGRCEVTLVGDEAEIRPALKDELGLDNIMQVPGLSKIVINMGIGDAVKDGRMLDAALEDLTIIAGQKPVVTKSRKSIANFKVRAGFPIGCMVTLRGARMYEFLDRLVNIAIPRIRDFRGVSNRAFDGRGNYSLGVREQIIFPEIEYDKIDVLRGMNIAITTTAKTDDEARALLAAFRFPFKH